MFIPLPSSAMRSSGMNFAETHHMSTFANKIVTHILLVFLFAICYTVHCQSECAKALVALIFSSNSAVDE
jgi:hypothetical protein